MEYITVTRGKHIVLRWCSKCQARTLTEQKMVNDLLTYYCLDCEEIGDALRRNG